MTATKQTRVGQIVGALACQHDSYLKSLETEVVSCEKYVPPKSSQATTKKKAKANDVPEQDLWLIECENSVLFPEGEVLRLSKRICS